MDVINVSPLHAVLGSISNQMLGNHDVKSVFWFTILIWNHFVMCDFDFDLNSFFGHFWILSQLEITNNLLCWQYTVNNLMSNDQIKKMFSCYNATLPSSALVERLFTSAGLTETQRRNRLTNSIFGKLLLLNIDKQWQ